MLNDYRSLVPAILIQAACAAADAPPDQAPSYDEIRNATVIGVHDEAVKLTDGRWEGEPYVPEGASRASVGIADDSYLTGDLDGDGTEEAVVVAWENSGGTGSYSFIAVFAYRDGAVVNLATAMIGDRVRVRDRQLSDGAIILSVTQHGPGDAACCPSQNAQRSWTMSSEGLTELESKIESQ